MLPKLTQLDSAIFTLRRSAIVWIRKKRMHNSEWVSRMKCAIAISLSAANRKPKAIVRTAGPPAVSLPRGLSQSYTVTTWRERRVGALRMVK